MKERKKGKSRDELKELWIETNHFGDKRIGGGWLRP